MRSYGKVYSTFWSDQRTATLSDRGKVMALYLLTGPHSNGIGCYRLPIGYVSEDLQWSAETVSETLSELLAVGFVDRCETTGWVFIPRFLRHNAPENPNVCKSLVPLIEAVPKNLPFFQGFTDAVQQVVEARPKGFPERFMERLRKGMPNKEPKPSHSQAIAKPQPEPAVPSEPGDAEEPPPVEPKAAAAAEEPVRAIIKLFDDCRAEVFGEERRRPYPGPKDWPVAHEIAAAGADPAVIRAAFLAVFQRQKAQGQQPAERLSYMRGPVAEAIARPAEMAKGSSPSSAPQRDRDGEFRVWMQFWREKRRWLGEGPSPDEPGCIVPDRIRNETLEGAA